MKHTIRDFISGIYQDLVSGGNFGAVDLLVLNLYLPIQGVPLSFALLKSPGIKILNTNIAPSTASTTNRVDNATVVLIYRVYYKVTILVVV